MKPSIRRSETGSAALLVAACLMLLMGMAAISIDFGVAFDDRRQQQSAADVGALAAAQYANTNHGTPAACPGGTLLGISLCRGAIEAMTVVAGTMNDRFAAGDWLACVDPGDAAYPLGSALSDCISFSDNLRKVRVVLPTSQVATSFGRVMGWNSISITSEAEVIADLNSSSDVIPFAIGPTGAGSTQSCLFANPTEVLNVDPCNGPSQGNFGFLDIALYGDDDIGTPTTCTGDTQGRLAANIVLGSDHELGKYDALTGAVRNDRTYCPITTALPNEVPTQTGGSNTGLNAGFFGGALGVEGRMMCKDGDANEEYRFPKASNDCVDVLANLSERLDDTPLWEYLNSGAFGESNGQCHGNVDTRQEMQACLNGWNSVPVHHTHLFTLDILQSPRFAATPELLVDPSNGTGNYLIVDYLPVYLETLYLGCNANTCDVVHSPGEPDTGPCPATMSSFVNSCGNWPTHGNKNLRALTSFILDLEMLHPDIAAHWPSRPGNIAFNLSK